MTLSILRGEEKIEYKRQKDRERKATHTLTRIKRANLSEEEKIPMREKDRNTSKVQRKTIRGRKNPNA